MHQDRVVPTIIYLVSAPLPSMWNPSGRRDLSAFKKLALFSPSFGFWSSGTSWTFPAASGMIILYLIRLLKMKRENLCDQLVLKPEITLSIRTGCSMGLPSMETEGVRGKKRIPNLGCNIRYATKNCVQNTIQMIHWLAPMHLRISENHK